MMRNPRLEELGRFGASIAVVLGLCAAVVACREPNEETAPAAAAAIPVRVVRARLGDIADERTVTGRTAALSTISVASPIMGRVTSLGLLPGNQVQAGDVVARVLPSENTAALQGFAVMEQAGGLSSRERALREQERRRAQSGDVPLRAPFPAVVSSRLHNPGEQVAPGDVLLVLFDPQSLYVTAQVPLEWANDVRPGVAADILSGSARAVGRVAALVPAIEGESLTVPVRIELTTRLSPPLLGAAVECRLTLARHSKALLIPVSALLTSRVDDQGTIMLAVANQGRLRRVRLGLRNEHDVEVTEGLTEGDLVVADGHYGLPDGIAIEPALDDE